ncbi:dephospho-CoA kinase [Marinococcus halophilus]|uniref:Dephospho-CoA kinase n=1 Tax=Marinococcus halophilus TaxID=1371 RepID=A0A510Y6L9_MARHA|nr:dephospho-CoA kinase [Marinococcus halophilus]OZT79965.1 dephospho-CoA kinase [Marinococcus halophilus]GEK58117.1 dephospho-CoA kinase [Marinococcus halophilus]
MVIGLTGGIASGKSLVADTLREQGLPVIDADVISREVVEPGEPALEQIIEHFGPEILQLDGTLDRKKLGSVIFNDTEKRQVLNQIIHPAVRQRMMTKRDNLVREGNEHVVLDIPLLLENNLNFLVDRVIVVYVNESTQKQRLIDRDGRGEEDAAARIKSQMPLEEKRHLADAVVDNSGTEKETKNQVNELLRQWKII